MIRRRAGRRRVRGLAAGPHGVERAADSARVGQVAPDRARRLAVRVDPVEQRFEIQALGGRELGAEDQRVVLTAPGLERGVTPVGAGELILDDDVGEVGLDVRRERGDRRDAGEVTVGELRELVLPERIERLTARPRHGLDRDEGQETVLTRQRELRVDPLDLDHAADVRVDVQTAVGVDLTPRDRAAGRGGHAARRAADVAREAAVVRAHLPVRQVDLEPEHGPDPADRELEVRTEPGAPVPLTVAVTGQVAVVRVPAHRRDLVEESGDRHLRYRRLGIARRGQHHEGDKGEDCRNEGSSHYRPPQISGEPQVNP